MKNKVIWALTAANVLLLLGLTTRLTAPAHAQQEPRASEYLMIPGDIVGGSSAIVWVIDSRNRQLSAVTSAANGKGVEMMKPIDLKRILP